MKEQQQWEGVLGFWFPEGRSLRIDPAEHRALWHWRMQGGADDAIITRFSSLTEQAANGQLDHWAQDPHGRLALIMDLLRKSGEAFCIKLPFSRSELGSYSRARNAAL